VAAYQGAIDLYKLRWIDFDVEGQAVAQPASVDRRNQAIKRLQVGVYGGRNWQMGGCLRAFPHATASIRTG
jgi:hypothetical protein